MMLTFRKTDIFCEPERSEDGWDGRRSTVCTSWKSNWLNFFLLIQTVFLFWQFFWTWFIFWLILRDLIWSQFFQTWLSKKSWNFNCVWETHSYLCKTKIRNSECLFMLQGNEIGRKFTRPFLPIDCSLLWEQNPSSNSTRPKKRKHLEWLLERAVLLSIEKMSFIQGQKRTWLSSSLYYYRNSFRLKDLKSFNWSRKIFRICDGFIWRGWK